MPRVLQVVHGFPPRENAGTEQYAARLAAALPASGWEVHTVAVAPAAGRAQYAVEEGADLTRVVNNTPYAGLRTGASDPAIDHAIERACARFRPDVVHVQHLAFASTTFRVAAPVVWTLHDAWAWCAAGGLLLRDGHPCAGPGPACTPCASAWAKDSPALARATRVAGLAGRVLSPDTVQSLWRRAPARLRARVLSGDTPPLRPEDLHRRDTRIRAFAAGCARIVSPSRWLADAAVAVGIPVTDVVPHGVDGTRGDGVRDGPFVFLGTLARHKGPDLVRAAHTAADLDVPLLLHGPPGPDAAWVASLPNDGPIPAAEVPSLLRRARALVLGSVWPENAPLVVLEARAAGCPVIAPAIGGIPEIVDAGVDGWLYPPGDVPALAACLREAVTRTLPVRRPPTLREHVDRLVAVYAAAPKERGW